MGQLVKAELEDAVDGVGLAADDVPIDDGVAEGLQHEVDEARVADGLAGRVAHLLPRHHTAMREQRIDDHLGRRNQTPDRPPAGQIYRHRCKVSKFLPLASRPLRPWWRWYHFRLLLRGRRWWW